MASKGMSQEDGGQDKHDQIMERRLSAKGADGSFEKVTETAKGEENKKNVGDLLIAIGEIFGNELVLNQRKNADKNDVKNEAHSTLQEERQVEITSDISSGTKKNLHICSTCKKAFSKKIQLKEHLFVHNGHLKFKCDFETCGWSFKSKYKLERHQAKHSDNSKYKCPYESCDRSFNEAYRLKSHFETHTEIHQCQEESCDMICSTAKELKTHTSKIHSQRVFKCVLSGCGNVFKSKSERENHMKIHRRFVCPFPGCQKPFTRKSYLDVHARSHTNERPFKCAYQGCFATFTSSSKLNRHQNAHKSSKPFVCTFKDCESSFKRKDNLNQHIKMHHCGDNKLACPFQDCSSKFSAKSSLKEHMSSHTKHEIYKCPIEGCTKTYYSKNLLRTHVKRHQKKIEKEENGEQEQDSRSFMVNVTLKTHDSAQHTDISVNEVLIPVTSDITGFTKNGNDVTGINSESTVIALGEAACFHYMNSADRLPVVAENERGAGSQEVKKVTTQNELTKPITVDSSTHSTNNLETTPSSNSFGATMASSFLKESSNPRNDQQTNKSLTKVTNISKANESLKVRLTKTLEQTNSETQSSEIESSSNMFSSGAVTVPLSMTQFLPREIQVNELFHSDYSDDHAYNRSLLPVDPRPSTACDNRNIDNVIETALTVSEFSNSFSVSNAGESLMEMRSFLVENGMASFLANEDIGRMETCTSQDDLRPFDRSHDLASSMMLDECIINHQSGSFNHYASNDSYVSLIGSSQIVNEHLLNISSNPTMIDHMYSQHSPEEDDLQMAGEDHVYEESTVNIQDIR